MAAATHDTESQFFYEDVVYRVDKRANVEFGIVMENDDQDMSDSSFTEESPKRKKGEVRVVWHPSGVDEYVNFKKVHLADRPLTPGDVVRRMIKGKDTQRGYCRNIELTACVQVLGTKQILTDIRSDDLEPLEEFGNECAVCLDSWVGVIKMINYKLWLSTPDGSRCTINEPEARGLEHFEEKRENGNDFPHTSEFFPGQCLWGPVNCLEQAQWITCTKEMKQRRKLKPYKITKVIVDKVETEWVGVHWQCRTYSKDRDTGSDQTLPKFVVEGEDLKKLKLLNVFEPSTVQVGDRNFYVIKGNENVITREQWRKRQKEVLQVPKPSPRKALASKTDDKKKDKVSEQNPPSNDSQENLSKKRPLMSLQVANTESSDDWDTEDTGSQSDSASISSGCSSMYSMGKKMKNPSLKLSTRVLMKKKKLYRTKKKAPPVTLTPGKKLVVETISTNTKANVVWQDGSVEFGIPSTQLYPIHHLDDKEFFPGDFVVDQKEEPRMYGVIQSVDHQGRMAKIKWFRTYAFSQNPHPTLIDVREVSVYDLKDHPDFQYRPGTVVIRIANPSPDCTAGQVLDCSTDGLVKVRWVDGHTSMCWPQDLYKVGEYDSDDGELWDEASSDGSWETEREDCVIADADVEQTEENLKPKLAANIEKARIAMSKLEVIFTQIPSLQTTEVMRQLLQVYKDCRYMDKLMGTSFFHEVHFQGLLERVRERGRVSVAQRMADQMTRLFTQEDGSFVESTEESTGQSAEETVQCEPQLIAKNDSTAEIRIHDDSVEEGSSTEEKAKETSAPDKNRLYININQNPEDSGHFSAENSKKESGSSESSDEFLLSEEANHAEPEKQEDEKEKNLLGVGSSHVCAKLCMLIRAQLVLAHAEVTRRFGLSKISLPDAAKSDSVEQKTAPAEESADSKPEPEVEQESIPEAPPIVYNEGEGFFTEETAPDSHKFKLTMFQPTDPANFFRAVSKELKLLQSSLPPGIWVKGFEDRIDLYSVMFRGPANTPYEDGLFLFDFQLSADYPVAPPLCHYISYCSDRLNPNLYEDGKVCVSLLGTWAGRGTELWSHSSTLLQVIVSIQGLILVSEPYFNEAGFEKQKGSQQGRENSRMYNEMVVLKLVQAQTKLLQNPPGIFKDVIIQHFHRHADAFVKRLEYWMDISEQYINQHPLSPVTPTTFKEIAQYDDKVLPEFPLIPASKGFCITLKKTIATFKSVLVREGIIKGPVSVETEIEATSEEGVLSPRNESQKILSDNLSSTSIASPLQGETKKDSSERNTS